MVGMAEAAQRVGFAPITRIDAATREIEVTATSEAVDAYGTIFDYGASKAAFARWLGNVREMHESVAVGRRVAVDYDDAARVVRVRLRISRGAEGTWQKILDGTLCGASIGAAHVTWEARRMAGMEEPVRVATAYDLVELSLVDNPANPDCLGIALVRGQMPDTEVLDALRDDAGTEDMGTPPGGHEEGQGATEDAGEAVVRDDGARLTPAEARAMRASAREMAAGLALLRGEVARAAREQGAALADLRARLERLEGQPQPGGPVLRAAEKVLGAPLGNTALNVPERIAALQAFGATRSDQRAQVEVAAEILRLQRGEG